jgi:hypothetical protein
LSGPSLNYST